MKLAATNWGVIAFYQSKQFVWEKTILRFTVTKPIQIVITTHSWQQELTWWGRCAGIVFVQSSRLSGCQPPTIKCSSSPLLILLWPLWPRLNVIALVLAGLRYSSSNNIQYFTPAKICLFFKIVVVFLFDQSEQQKCWTTPNYLSSTHPSLEMGNLFMASWYFRWRHFTWSFIEYQSA